MKKMIVLVPLFLAGCLEVPPAVSDFNGSSVKIQQSTAWAPANANDPEVANEARRICGKVGKRAEYASTRYNPNAYYAEHLFLCL